MKSEVFNMDCMEGMKQYPDKYFDLAIVDPPYEIERFKNPKGRLEKYGDTRKGNNNKPDKKYFSELFRVSKNQIIWGGNYFDFKLGNGTIVWDKGLYGKTNYSDGEIAWSSFNIPLRIIQVRYDGFLGADDDGRIHPFQKPIKLYKKLLKNYAKEGDKILDTHLGSGSSRIACYDYQFDFTGFEIDKEYFDLQEERFKQHSSQLSFSDLMEG